MRRARPELQHGGFLTELRTTCPIDSGGPSADLVVVMSDKARLYLDYEHDSRR